MFHTLQSLVVFVLFSLSTLSYANNEVIVDKNRDRAIAINIALPSNGLSCSEQNKCPVVFINAGYGISHTDYQFAADIFTSRGYLTIAVAHELKGDPALDPNQPYMATRMENWHRGVVTLKFLVNELNVRYPAYDFSQLTLFGHSNGGDISALYAAIYPNEVSAVITLDHRRMLLPRNKNILVLTLRGSDYPADADVLLNERELSQYPVKQITIEQARHNDMYDGGSKWLIERMRNEINAFLGA
ncbi:alpha/beta hydrolase [Pseudoalteromonas sp. S1727]|uniref:alpha/beta fold hydrolase n=1 Tax=Pseudoalteromonas sp. S1727 TaxID=2066514 RepID=UPI001109646F|nr:alpha/beta fold hydrolase [Pseudoalteromonas sp. S1727]TMN67493.1 alpha/beta hydrolase [Pseudoalteromonas sp. S1727]